MNKLIIGMAVICICSTSVAMACPSCSPTSLPSSQKPIFSGCFESYLDNLIREASSIGKAEGEHMGYDISMIRYINNQECVVDIAIYSGQRLVDRRMVKCME